MTHALIIPCPLYVAHGWACGWIGDVDVMLAPRSPEAAYWQTLGNLDAFRAGLPQMLQLWRAGASLIVLRTNSPAVVHHVEKWGGVRTFQDPSGRWRYRCDGEMLNRYFGRMAQKAAAASGATISR